MCSCVCDGVFSFRSCVIKKRQGRVMLGCICQRVHGKGARDIPLPPLMVTDHVTIM